MKRLNSKVERTEEIISEHENRKIEIETSHIWQNK